MSEFLLPELGLRDGLMAREDARAIILDGHYLHSFPSGWSWSFYYGGAVVVYSIPANKNLATFLFDTGAPFGSFPERPETSHQTSLEVRLSNNTDQLNWVAGAYYYNESQFVQNRVYAGLIQDVGQVSNLDTRSYAAFGQATLSLTDTFRLIGGARYTSDRRSLSNGATYAINPTFAGATILAPPCLPPNPATTCLLEQYEGVRTFSNVSWKVGIEADVFADSLFFATASSGFKAASINLAP